jgi:isopentenyl diphosphate isomerase/L-lactate dehydrogenase-like FMN-dependent dehydrogenase
MQIDLSDRFRTLHEIIKAAKERLEPGPWDYLMGGTETETTLRRNRQALDSIAFRPRVLRNVEVVDTTSSLLGRPVRLPVMIAPMGSMESFTPGGGATAARAAAAFGVPLMLSCVCQPPLEEVAAAAPDILRIYQLYVRGNETYIDDYVKRAVDSGYQAFCLTVDVAIYSRRERDLSKRYLPRSRSRADGYGFQAALSWDDVKRFKDTHAIPLAIKGIATAEDALIALEHGVEIIYVSNHGGRQLDHGRGAIDVLPEVVQAVAGRAVVIVDGGFMRGTDVVKAIALGAQAVGIGKLAGLGMAAADEAGLFRTLEILEDEVRICLGLLGVDRFDKLDGSYLHAATPVAPAHVTSPFPLIAEGY